MVEMKVVDEFLILDDISFVDRNNLVKITDLTNLKIIYIRECYKQLASLIYDQKVDNFVITGTPGIGKTMFRNYMVFSIIENYSSKNVEQEFTIVLDKCPGSVFLNIFKAKIDINGAISWNWCADNRENILRNCKSYSNIWSLLDVSEGDSKNRISGYGRTIMFTSPSESAYAEFAKENCVIYYMPTWDYEEVKKINEKLEIDVKTLEERWERYGGIPRVLFASDIVFLQYKTDRINNAIDKLTDESHFKHIDTATATKEVRHSLLYYEVEPESKFINAKLNWGSFYIKPLVGDKYAEKIESDMNNVIDTLRTCLPGSLKGLLLKPIALKLLSKANGSFKCVRLDEGRDGLELVGDLPIGPLNAIYDVSDKNFDNVLKEYGEIRKENVMIIPSNARFPAVDAVVIVTVGNNRHYYMLQVSINKHHGVKGVIAKEMVENIVNIAGGIGNCAYIYVLPNNDIFKKFTDQDMPKCQNEIVPQYKIALKQQDGNIEPKLKKLKSSRTI
jgi:hypothetical protein